MIKDGLRYDKMVESALRGVVRDAIGFAVANGLPGGHHFYITFKTARPGSRWATTARAIPRRDDHRHRASILGSHGRARDFAVYPQVRNPT